MMFLDWSIATKGVPSEAFWYRVSSYRICRPREGGRCTKGEYEGGGAKGGATARDGAAAAAAGGGAHHAGDVLLDVGGGEEHLAQGAAVVLDVLHADAVQLRGGAG
jgi:hypothetical protein